MLPWLFLLGATLGTMLDALHVYSKVERYASPAFFGLAWWVPLLHHRRHRPLLNSIIALAWIPLAYLISASVFDTFTKTGLLLLIYINFWLLTGGSWQTIVLSLVTAITGTLIEMILVAAGAFSYLHPDLLGVPYWLPCIYACASLALGDLGRSLFYSSGGML